MTHFSVLARPKVNLFLHVLGRRPDGYHTLESLAVFAETGDRVRAEPSAMLSLSMEGLFAISLDAGADNLVIRAALALQEWARAAGQDAPGAALHLEKRLPVASGIGGGSADAAAALIVLRQLWGLDIADDALAALGGALGADVPVCVESRGRMMRGIGDELLDIPPLPKGWLVLANPMQQVSTPAVFSSLVLDQSAAPVTVPSAFGSMQDLAAWLGEQTGNDLEAPARALAPIIGTVLNVLNSCEGTLLARMSGSGATCFGLYPDRETACAAEHFIRTAHPDWWVEAATLVG